MTNHELSQLYWLNREIEQDKQRLAELRSLATSTSPCISGMPHASGKSDKTALAVEIAYLDGVIQNKIERTYHEYNRLLAYIDSIDDSLTRQIFTMRYVNGYSWNKCAAKLGSGNSWKNLSNICYRYIATHKS